MPAPQQLNIPNFDALVSAVSTGQAPFFANELGKPTSAAYVGSMAIKPKKPGLDMDKDYVYAKIEASEARSETRFTEIVGELKAIHARLDAAPTKWQLWGAVFTASGTLLGIMLTVLAFAGDRFDAGIGFSGMRADQAETDARQDAQFNLVIEKLDGLAVRMGAIEAKVSAAP